MTLPAKYLKDTVSALTPLCMPKGVVSLRTIQQALGKAARIGYVVPDTSPFIASLWPGYRAGRQAAADNKPGTSQDKLPCRRFAVAATWLCTLLREALSHEKLGVRALTRVMDNNGRKLAAAAGLPSISFDASPWGGGGIIWFEGEPKLYTHFVWADHTLRVLKAQVGDHRHQTTFEFFTLFLVAVTFQKVLESTGATILGDNLAALNEALNTKSTKPLMNTISREIAWRRIVRGWQYSVRHLPAEMNDEADCLSRLQAPGDNRKDFPVTLLRAKYMPCPSQNASLWRARIQMEK